ncbi:MAG: GntR family transcriptional regulator, partial [Rhodospirillaceae bacterium]|nr:GntR family transcriptional regulator [Rhodospirillaceae bacterium]
MADKRAPGQEPRPAAGPGLGDDGRHVGYIAAQLREAIRSGFYVNGDQLPAERELAARFD